MALHGSPHTLQFHCVATSRKTWSKQMLHLLKHLLKTKQGNFHQLPQSLGMMFTRTNALGNSKLIDECNKVGSKVTS